MILVNGITQESLTTVLLLLTPSETKELLDKLEALTPEAGDHFHVNNEEFTKEITVAIYTPANTKYFAEDIRKLIEQESN